MDKSVVLGVVTNNDKVLLVKRKPTEGMLRWQFPGGIVEKNETVEDAIVRELKEETGIDVKALTRIGERVHPYTNRYMAYIACEYLSGGISVSDDDLECAEWVGIDSLDEHFTTPLFDKVADYLSHIPKEYCLV